MIYTNFQVSQNKAGKKRRLSPIDEECSENVDVGSNELIVKSLFWLFFL